MKTEKFTGPSKVLLILGRRTGAHREDWTGVYINSRCRCLPKLELYQFSWILTIMWYVNLLVLSKSIVYHW